MGVSAVVAGQESVAGEAVVNLSVELFNVKI